jgi:hypothetical protein
MEKPRSVRKTQQEREHGENSGMSLELPLSFEAKTKNPTTGEMISSSASESREKEPIFYNFMPIPEIDQPQISKEYVFATKTHDGSEEVSTEPFVYGSCITKKRKATENLANFPVFLSLTAFETKRLNLVFNPWVIKKRIGTEPFAGIFLHEDLMKKHVLPLWDARLTEKIKDGVQVGVWDCDTNSEHQLLFQQWAISGSSYYVVIGKPWVTEFVKRRGLNKGDEIGLYWDQRNSRFNFSVLKFVLSN